MDYNCWFKSLSDYYNTWVISVSITSYLENWSYWLAFFVCFILDYIMMCWILCFKTLDPISILWKRLAFLVWFCFNKIWLCLESKAQVSRVESLFLAAEYRQFPEREHNTYMSCTPIWVLRHLGLRLYFQLLIFYLFSHRNFKEIQQRKSNPKNCITSKARGLLQDVTQMAFISQVDILFCKIALLKNMLSGRGPVVLKLCFP